ncbi:WUSCHEL-related homeobox 11-like isoform X2 [Vigna umbellata]|uniref:WUSCHEL-related homeobox 11-like isoform X2 n=1 Tax=Vigna umbellata TaxID=87088 RepID=UPI001F5FCCAA|nr:WUSCHEL-related homeobox 11-like isoform X2 [Vigna umbellata]
MEDHQGQEQQQQQQKQQQQQQPNSPNQQASERTEPVRSRWTPKPEQILILESIFNSGMVNPPKDETVRIRKLLEKFGTVGDANVFYWFQNRRSRSRRRQRQIQATLNQGGGASTNPFQPHHQNNPALVANLGFGCATSSFLNPSYIPPRSSSSSSSCGGAAAEESFDDFFPPSTQMGFPGIDHHASAASSSSVLYPLEASNLNYHSGFGGISGLITVFINGVPTEVPRGPMDIKTAFGEDGLQHGESYFVVSKQTQV